MSLFKEDILQHRAPEELVPAQGTGPVLEEIPQIGLGGEPADPVSSGTVHRAVLIDKPEAAVDDVSMLCFHGLRHPPAGVRLKIIVSIHKGDVFAGGDSQTGVSGGGGTGVGLMDHPDAAILPGISVADGTAPIRGAVIDQDDLQLPVCLGEDAFDAFFQIGFDPVNRNNDRNHAAFDHK